MAKDLEMLGVLVAPAQKAKVKRWANAMGADMSTAVRTLIDAVEMEVKPAFVVKPPPNGKFSTNNHETGVAVSESAAGFAIQSSPIP